MACADSVAGVVASSLTGASANSGPAPGIGKDKEAKSYPITKDTKFSQMVKKDDKEVKEKIEGGTKASAFQKISDKGIGAMIELNDMPRKGT